MAIVDKFSPKVISNITAANMGKNEFFEIVFSNESGNNAVSIRIGVQCGSFSLPINNISILYTMDRVNYVHGIGVSSLSILHKGQLQLQVLIVCLICFSGPLPSGCHS